MKFLISNDDGVNAPGLLALYHALSAIGEVTVVAPDTEQSGCASALHLSQPLYTQVLESGFVSVTGTPADCIYLALNELFATTHFDCVITGINSGANVGQDVLFSGTFGGALTAQLFGIPAIATSLSIETNDLMSRNDKDKSSYYKIAAEQIVNLITETLILSEIKHLPYHVLNVNIPSVKTANDIKGYRVTQLSHSKIAQPVQHIIDPRGRDAYWLSLRKDNVKCEDYANHKEYANSQAVSLDNMVNSHVNDNNISNINSTITDIEALSAGYISISPVRLHHTPTSALNSLSKLFL